MTFCTIVEFEWNAPSDGETLGQLIGGAGESDHGLPDGCLSRLVSIDDEGARIIEVWRSGADAQAFAEQTGQSVAAAQLPPPSRVAGFEVTSYVVS